jgi:2-dehydropantoate 2-reductase
MRIHVLGAGAVGSVLGGLLAQSGHDVSFMEKGKAAGKMAGVRIGLPDRLLSVNGVQRFDVKGSPPGGRPDFLFVCLGRDHLRALKKEALRRFIDPELTRVVFCNADPEEARRFEIPAPMRCFLLALLDAVKLQEGDVEVVSDNPCIVEERNSHVGVFASDFAKFGIAVHAVDDILPCLDSLYVFELLFLPVALCNTTLGHFLSFASGRNIARALLAEGLKVMERCGRPLARLPAMDPRALMERIAKDPSGLDAARFLPDRFFPPILQSFMRGSPGEARELNKKIVELGASVGLELPLNWTLYQKAGRPAGVGFYPNPDELAKALA